jgi:hypothetical protein
MHDTRRSTLEIMNESDEGWMRKCTGSIYGDMG